VRSAVNEDGTLSELHTRSTSSGVDLSDTALQSVWDDVKDDSSDTNWCWFTYDNGHKTRIAPHSSGAGGFVELCSRKADDQIMYGGLRVSLSDTMTKFVFIYFAGEGVGAMAKGRAGMHKQGVQVRARCDCAAETMV
jgi:hypothetical protein